MTIAPENQKAGAKVYLADICLPISCHDDMDFSQIVTYFGGGGHKSAAGFICSNLDSLNTLLKENE